MSDLYEQGETRRRKLSKVWTYPQTPRINAPYERSIYTAVNQRDLIAKLKPVQNKGEIND
jgi:hypothetical protein